MTAQEAFDKLLEIISGDLKHADYDRVCELSDFYKKLNTGKGIEEELRQFAPREDDIMFEQRQRLTIPITPAAASSIKKPFYKVPRTQPVTKKITAKTDANKTAVTEIEESIKNFYGSENNVGGLDYYFQNRFVDLSFDDPNLWIVIEFDSFDPATEKAQPRPFEVGAHEAVNFSIVNNMVEWLVIALDITLKENEKDDRGAIITYERPGKKYTLYADNDAWAFEQLTTNTENTPVIIPQGIETISIEGKGQFSVTHFETLTTKVPAFRIGYIRDIETNGRTYVNPYHDALCYFKKSIKQGSEFDLTTCLHTFPQKVVRLTKSCPGVGMEKCFNGRLTDGSVCTSCQGTGRSLIHGTAQDVIEVEMVGKDDPDYVALTDFIYYVQQPIDVMKLQKEWIDDLKSDIHQCVFNSQVLLRKSNNASIGSNPIDPTATEVDKDMESVYDTLTPFAEKIAAAWITITELIAIITDNADKVTIIYRPASKFKLKTRQDLYAERATVTQSGVPAFVIDSIDDELAQDIYADDAEGLLRYMVKKEHYPFVGKNQDEIALLLASTTVLKKTKVLYNYFDEIFTQLEREFKTGAKDFYLEKADARQAAIDAKVDEIIQELSQENNTAMTFKMNALLGSQGQSDATTTQTDNTQAA